MKTIIIKTQDELDALPDSFEEYTRIEIRTGPEVHILVTKAWGNSRVEALDYSRVEARENSFVVARDNSRVVARGHSRVVAWENSSVEAWGNSSVEAWGHSRVVAWGHSRVVAWGHSRVVAWGNSRVEALENSHVEAWENSSVEAWGNSQIELFISAYVIVLTASVVVKKLLDHSTAVFKGCPVKIEEKSETAHARAIPGNIEVSFEAWLSRGYVYADGICKKLKSQKKIGDVEVFEVEEFLDRKASYVVKRGDTFSHGETIEKAIEDLRYKISDRDTSEFESWRENKDQEITLDDAIAGYRVITGACEFGAKQFVESIQVPRKLTPKVIVEMTKGQFGNEKFAEFLNG